MKNIIYSSPKTSFVLRKIKINAAKRKIKNGVKVKNLKNKPSILLMIFVKLKLPILKLQFVNLRQHFQFRLLF